MAAAAAAVWSRLQAAAASSTQVLSVHRPRNKQLEPSHAIVSWPCSCMRENGPGPLVLVTGPWPVLEASFRRHTSQPSSEVVNSHTDRPRQSWPWFASSSPPRGKCCSTTSTLDVDVFASFNVPAVPPRVQVWGSIDESIGRQLRTHSWP